MTTTEPRWRRRPESRRDELLDAARDLFVVQGVETTTVADIVGAAGLAKGSFYRYFASKDDLFTALKTRLVERMQIAMQAAVNTAVAPAAGEEAGAVDDRLDGRDAPPPVLSSPEQAAAVIDGVVAAAVLFMFDERDVIAVWWSQPQNDGPGPLTQGIGNVVRLLGAAIAEGAELGVVDCPSPTVTARLLTYAVQSTTMHAILSYSEPRPEPVIEAAQRLARRALKLPDPPWPAPA